MLDLFKESWFQSLIGTAVGALVTWIVARFYYKRAGDELHKEAEALRHETSTILSWLEHSDTVKELIRDEDGAVAGIAFFGEPPTGAMHMKGYPPTVTIGEDTKGPEG